MRHGLMIGISVSALALSACNPGVDAAKSEMTQACVASAGGQLSEEECGCMTDKAFDSLNGEERDFMAAVSSTDPDISEEDLAEELGMDIPEMRAMTRTVTDKLMSNSFSNARSCVTEG